MLTARDKDFQETTLARLFAVDCVFIALAAVIALALYYLIWKNTE
ncbi:hypothetical protein [Paraburkholderia diazotrophica]|uniref:Uncharacterized protein n=1 Tax=Paraburkholderia diazotrophica TaxID=667676 RepID=A0A1H7EAH0_9BURK|nr:hypothetical protein [Paraburkholderia diazotrophica]SEK10899.1 hypothetical protein SAMN05192539_104940 [Paraburkholderia diazotrophica]